MDPSFHDIAFVEFAEFCEFIDSASSSGKTRINALYKYILYTGWYECAKTFKYIMPIDFYSIINAVNRGIYQHTMNMHEYRCWTCFGRFHAKTYAFRSATLCKCLHNVCKCLQTVCSVCTNRIIFEVFEVFSTIRLIHLIGRKPLHFEKITRIFIAFYKIAIFFIKTKIHNKFLLRLQQH